MRFFRLTMKKKEAIQGYIFVLPFIIGIILFFAFPIFTSLRLSFSKLEQFTGLQKMTWAGVNNYMEAFYKDVEFVPMFLIVIKDTLINSPLIVIFSLVIAVFINKQLKLKGFFRAVFFLPFLLGTGYVLQKILGFGTEKDTMSISRGITLPEHLKQYFGPIVWKVLSEILDRVTLIFWKSGVQILLFLSGLQGIPKSLYESAKCDSATEWEMFWKITLPMISPIILLNMVYTIVDSFTDVNNKIVDYFSTEAFRWMKLEYSCAMSWIYFAFIMAVLGIIFFSMRRAVFYSGRD